MGFSTAIPVIARSERDSNTIDDNESRVQHGNHDLQKCQTGWQSFHFMFHGMLHVLFQLMFQDSCFHLMSNTPIGSIRVHGRQLKFDLGSPCWKAFF